MAAFFQLIHFLLDTTRKANTGGDSQLETLGWCSGTPNQLFGHKKARQPLLRSSHVRGSLGKNVLCSHFTRQGSDSPIGTATDLKIETSASAVIERCVRGLWPRLSSKEVLGEDCVGDSWPGQWSQLWLVGTRTLSQSQRPADHLTRRSLHEKAAKTCNQPDLIGAAVCVQITCLGTHRRTKNC